MKKCIYCKGKKKGVPSREHVISKSVLEVAFGPNIRNITEMFGKTFIDHEQLIKDVCSKCNSDLSPYDVAGQKLANSIKDIYSANEIKFPIDKFTINWFIKTHLNLLRMIPDCVTKQKYEINYEIYRSISEFRNIPQNLCEFYIEGWEGLERFWDESSTYKIEYFGYKSVRFIDQNIIVSNFRFKCIDTFLFLPCNNSYNDFKERVSSVLEEMKEFYGFDLQYIEFRDQLDKNIDITKMVSTDRLLNNIKINE